MPGRVIQRPAAKRDLIECFAHIGVDNEPAALRFLQASNEIFHELAEMPGMGEATIFRNPNCGTLRRWRVKGFTNFLIFYRPLDDGIEVVRVLHGARETEKLFE